MKQYISRILGALFLAVGVAAYAFADTEYIRAADLGSLPGWFLYTEDVSLLPSAEYPKMYEDDTGAAGELLLKNNTLSCHDAQLTSLQSLATIQSLMKISDVAKAYFPRNNLVDVTPLAVYNNTLRALWLSDNTLTELPRGLELLTQLEKLCLDTNQLTSLAGIEALVSLKTLCLRDNQLSDLSVLSKLPQLVSLNVQGNRLTRIDEAWLLPGMVELHVDDEVLLPVSWCTNYKANTHDQRWVNALPKNYTFVEYDVYQEVAFESYDVNIVPRCVRLKSGAVFVAGVGDVKRWVSALKADRTTAEYFQNCFDC